MSRSVCTNRSSIFLMSFENRPMSRPFHIVGFMLLVLVSGATDRPNSAAPHRTPVHVGATMQAPPGSEKIVDAQSRRSVVLISISEVRVLCTGHLLVIYRSRDC